MMWLIPRTDPGALTEYRRPHAGGVSTEDGKLLPYGSYPRLVMLWMYAECAHAIDIPPEERDPITSICDFLLALDVGTRGNRYRVRAGGAALRLPLPRRPRGDAGDSVHRASEGLARRRMRAMAHRIAAWRPRTATLSAGS